MNLRFSLFTLSSLVVDLLHFAFTFSINNWYWVGVRFWRKLLILYFIAVRKWSELCGSLFRYDFYISDEGCNGGVCGGLGLREARDLF